jgi:uncharacterized membrane protein
MAIYFIIGGDKKEYGPITAGDMRQWVAEGRLNAQSLAKAEGEASWSTLGTIPEFADLFGAGTPPPIATSLSAPANVDFLERDYELDLGGCISQGWGLVKDNMNVLLVAVLIWFGIEFVASVLGNIPLIGPVFTIANFVISGPLMGGLLYLSVRVIRREPAQVGDVFLGFKQAFGQLFLANLVQALIAGLCLMPFFIVIGVKAAPLLAQWQQLRQQLQNGTPPSPETIAAIKAVIVGGLPVLLVCAIPLTYLVVSWKFSLPLILDKRMDFWTAMKTSWKMVNKHWWQVFGLILLIELLNLAGFCACCIGLVFTVPVGFASLMFAYETIFGARKN